MQNKVLDLIVAISYGFMFLTFVYVGMADLNIPFQMVAALILIFSTWNIALMASLRNFKNDHKEN